MDEKVLEAFYQERLEEKIIEYLSEAQQIDYRRAMDIYYNSALAELIHEGKYGAQYLDHKVLVDTLIETEPQLFRQNKEVAL